LNWLSDTGGDWNRLGRTDSLVFVQSVVQSSDISTVSSMIVYVCQLVSLTSSAFANDIQVTRAMGGAIFASAGQSAFTNVLIRDTVFLATRQESISIKLWGLEP